MSKNTIKVSNTEYTRETFVKAWLSAFRRDNGKWIAKGSKTDVCEVLTGISEPSNQTMGELSAGRQKLKGIGVILPAFPKGRAKGSASKIDTEEMGELMALLEGEGIIEDEDEDEGDTESE